MMTQLTDTQLVLLSAASQRHDGLVPIHERLKGTVATAVGTKLTALGLAEERMVPSPTCIWRRHDDGEMLALFITPKGLAAIGVQDGFAEATVLDGSAIVDPEPVEATIQNPAIATSATPVRAGTKKSQVIALLARGEGASVAELMATTGWLRHTTRAVLSGLRKTGMEIIVMREAGSTTRYRLTCLNQGGVV